MTCSRHADFEPGCFGCKVRTVGFSAHAMPTRRPDVVEIDQREDRWHRDMGAYKRLRRDGLQPRGIDGCGDLEQTATTRAAVEGTPELPDG